MDFTQLENYFVLTVVVACLVAGYVIKKWIKEQYNVSVSSLYIAQVKDKLGFEKRENYNKGADGHRVPNCPAEKEKLILEAFEHFRMI